MQPEKTLAKTLPTTPTDLFNLLAQLGISYELHRHEPIFTVQEGLHLKATIPGLHCRNLFLKDKKDRMFLVVAANDTRVDMKRLEPVLGSARLSFGSPERLWTYLGITPGSVCPFVVVNDPEHKVEIVLDDFMMKADIVCYHPLDNSMSICLTPADLLKFFAHTGHAAKILDLSAAAPT
jgi:Ala-tRNA(Pro) deacylase